MRWLLRDKTHDYVVDAEEQIDLRLCAACEELLEARTLTADQQTNEQ